MVTITIKGGEKSFRMSQTGRRHFEAVLSMLEDIDGNYDPLSDHAKEAWPHLEAILKAANAPKPSAKPAE